MTRNINSSAIV